ncbi:eCIS core domain-containing protein [Micromonospora echinospora]
MAWPFRLRRPFRSRRDVPVGSPAAGSPAAGSAVAGPAGAGEATAPVDGTVGSAPARRDWTRLAALPLTVAPGPAMATVAVPRVAGSEPLLAAPAAPDPGTAPRGQVTGLAAARPVTGYPGPHPADSAGEERRPAVRVASPVTSAPEAAGAPRTLPVVVAPVSVRAPLTVADGEAVGPPRTPEHTVRDANPLGAVPPSAGPTEEATPAGDPGEAARAAARFAAAGLPTVDVWPPPGFEDVYRAAEVTRAAEAARAAGGPVPGAAARRENPPPRPIDRVPGAGTVPGEPSGLPGGPTPRPVEVVSRSRSARAAASRPAPTAANAPVVPAPDGPPADGAGVAQPDVPAGGGPGDAVPAVGDPGGGPRGAVPDKVVGVGRPSTPPHPTTGPSGLPTAPGRPGGPRSGAVPTVPEAASARPAGGDRSAALSPARFLTRRAETPPPARPASSDQPDTTAPASAGSRALPVRPDAGRPAVPSVRSDVPRPAVPSVRPDVSREAVPPVQPDVSREAARPVRPDEPRPTILSGPPDVAYAVVTTDSGTAGPSGDISASPPVAPVDLPPQFPASPAGGLAQAASTEPWSRPRPAASATPLAVEPPAPGFPAPAGSRTGPTDEPTPPARRPAPPAGPATGTPVVADPWPVSASVAEPAPATDGQGIAVPRPSGSDSFPDPRPATWGGTSPYPVPFRTDPTSSDVPVDGGPGAGPAPTGWSERPAVPSRHRAVLPDLPARVPPVVSTPPTPVAPLGVEPLTPVPATLVNGFRQRYGVDVSDVPVRRGPAATALVRQAGARAATRGGEVLLPAEAGPLDAPPVRALLAHELAHVVQQRVLGATPPAESTGAGRDLEARALAAEYAFGDGAVPAGVGATVPPLPLVGPGSSAGSPGAFTPGGAAGSPVSGSAAGPVGTWGTTAGGGLTWRADPDGSLGSGPPLQRAPVGGSADALADLRDLVRAEVARQEDTVPGQGPEPTPDGAAALAALRAEVAAATSPPAFDRSSGRLAEVSAAVEQLRGELRAVTDREGALAARPDRDAAGPRPDRSPARAVDLDNPDDLEELAGRLYGRLRGRLRQELLVDRERSGRLTRFP